MIQTIEFKGEVYPKFQSEGNAFQFALPYAKKVLFGKGYDIGCNRTEWAYPGAIMIDPNINPQYNATTLPEKEVDYITSSHCLEHLDRWVDVLDYWYDTLRVGGVLFLYLPDVSQKYWLPYNNRKHVNIFTPSIIKNYLIDKGYKNIFVSGVDLNNSFVAIGEKFL